MKQLTLREKEIYLYIVDYHSKNGYSPSIRDICAHHYLSISSVQRHLGKIIDKGYISYTPKVARSLVVIESQAV